MPASLDARAKATDDAVVAVDPSGNRLRLAVA
jgi:hypothetical protein